MGSEIACEAKIGTRRARGRALLETNEIVFRGDERFVLPLAELGDVSSEDGVLVLRHKGKRYELHLGARAAKWADRIRHPKTRLDKLGVKAGSRVVVLDVRDESFADELRERGAKPVKKDAEILFLGAHAKRDLSKIASLVDRIAPHGAIWVVRPKGSSALTERDVMAAGRDAGLVDVKVCAFSPTHTAEKFVVPLKSR
jgi:hypothetical protein